MPGPITCNQLITDAFLDAAIIAAGEPLVAADAQLGQSHLSRLLDLWSAEELNIFAMDFLQFVLVPNVQPLTIGQAFVIASAQLTGNVATYIGPNTLQQGQFVDIYGCTTAAFNAKNVQVINPTPTQWQVAIVNANIGLEVETGAQCVFTGYTPPTFSTITQRPAKIQNCNIILNNVNPITKTRVNIRDADWWAANQTPQTATTLPTDLYYNPQWPNGYLYFWPLQQQNYGVELEVWVNLADIPSLTYGFYLPQAYRDAITLTLAEKLCLPYEKPISMDLARQARTARSVLKQLNSKTPRIQTRDAGIPSGGGTRNYFNWLNGTTTPRI